MKAADREHLLKMPMLEPGKVLTQGINIFRVNKTIKWIRAFKLITSAASNIHSKAKQVTELQNM